MSDLYAVLGVAKTATDDEIKKAYREKVFSLHPDRNPGDLEATKKFKEVQSAYDILSDQLKRKDYDRTGATTTKYQTRGRGRSSGFRPFNDKVDEWTKSYERGTNIQVQVNISLAEVLTNTTKTVTVSMKVPCKDCEGRGYADFVACSQCSGSGKTAQKVSPFNFYSECRSCKGSGRSGTVKCSGCNGETLKETGKKDVSVHIPAGTENGWQLRLPGQGSPSPQGGENGDLFITVLVGTHPVFRRVNKDLFADVPVSYSELILGSVIDMNNLAGQHIRVKIPPMTKPDAELICKNMGLPNMGGVVGNLYLKLKLEMISNINDDLKQALELLNKAEMAVIVPRREKDLKGK